MLAPDALPKDIRVLRADGDDERQPGEQSDEDERHGQTVGAPLDEDKRLLLVFA